MKLLKLSTTFVFLCINFQANAACIFEDNFPVSSALDILSEPRRNGNYVFKINGDGNIVLYKNRKPKLSLDTQRLFTQGSFPCRNSANCKLVLHTDGNIVLKHKRNDNFENIWASGSTFVSKKRLKKFCVNEDRLEIKEGGQVVYSSHPNNSSRVNMPTDSITTPLYLKQRNVYLRGLSKIDGAVNFEQVPKTSFLIGRRKIRGKNFFKLTKNTMNWKLNTIQFNNDLSFEGGNSSEIISAYDPSVLVFNGVTYVAFECYIMDSSAISSCVGELDLARSKIKNPRVVIEGFNRDYINKYSASVPKIFTIGDDIFMAWTQVHIGTKGTWKSLKSLIAKVDITDNTVKIMANDGVEWAKADGAKLHHVDFFGSKKIVFPALQDEEYIYFTGAKLPDGCLRPTDKVHECYELVIYRRKVSDLNNLDSDQKLSQISRLTNFTKVPLPRKIEEIDAAQEYFKIIQKPWGNSKPIIVGNYVSSFPYQGLMSFDFIEKRKSIYLSHLFLNILGDSNTDFNYWYKHSVRIMVEGIFKYYRNNSKHTRVEYIRRLYRALLERRPSQREVDFYVKSSLSEEQLTNLFISSPEYTLSLSSRGLKL